MFDVGSRVKTRTAICIHNTGMRELFRPLMLLTNNRIRLFGLCQRSGAGVPRFEQSRTLAGIYCLCVPTPPYHFRLLYMPTIFYTPAARTQPQCHGRFKEPPPPQPPRPACGSPGERGQSGDRCTTGRDPCPPNACARHDESMGLNGRPNVTADPAPAAGQHQHRQVSQEQAVIDFSWPGRQRPAAPKAPAPSRPLGNTGTERCQGRTAACAANGAPAGPPQQHSDQWRSTGRLTCSGERGEIGRANCLARGAVPAPPRPGRLDHIYLGLGVEDDDKWSAQNHLHKGTNQPQRHLQLVDDDGDEESCAGDGCVCHAMPTRRWSKIDVISGSACLGSGSSGGHQAHQ